MRRNSTRVNLTYTTPNGETVTRKVAPVRIMWASRTDDGGAMTTNPVPEPEWLLDCHVLDLGVAMEIRMASVTGWEQCEL